MKKNVYAEILEEANYFKNYLNLSTISDLKKKISRASNVIKKEKSLIKDNSISGEEYNNLINDRSNYSLDEHNDSTRLANHIFEVTRKKISTFDKRLSIIGTSEVIKKYLTGEVEGIKAISFTEAISLNKMARDNDTIVKESVDWLTEKESFKGKRPTSKEFEMWLLQKTKYKKKNRGHAKRNKKDDNIDKCIIFKNCTFIFN